MHVQNPAALAIIEALRAPGLDDSQRGALLGALQALHAPVAATAEPPAKARKARAIRADRRADAVRLTREAIAAMGLPAEGERYVYDTITPQLAVRLRPGGRTYIVVMWDRSRGRAVKHTLGKTEALTPEQARRQAQALVAAVADGKDVRRVTPEGMTLADLIDRWHAEKSHGKRTADELKAKALHYLGRLAYRPAGEVTRQDIGAIHYDIATKARKRVRKLVADGTLQAVETGPAGLPATADKWRATINAIYEWGMRKGLVSANPAEGIEKAFDAKSAARTNYLHGDALLRFWRALEEDHDADTRDALLMLLYTGQRRGNVLEMRWADVDIEHGLWSLQATDTKQRKAQTTPLSAQARAILVRRHESTASQWVFPAVRVDKDGKLPAMSETRLRDAWHRICAAAGIEGLRIHDLRHTAGSWLARLGANEAVRQKALGHQTPAMAARYSHLELDPVADALQRMGDAVTAAATRPLAAVRSLK